MRITSVSAAIAEKWQRFNAGTWRVEQQNSLVFDLSTAWYQHWNKCLNVWLRCSVFLSTVEQRLSLHQQLPISLLKFSLSLHLPLHILSQSLEHKRMFCTIQIRLCYLDTFVLLFTICLLGMAVSSCFFSWVKVCSSVAACSTWWTKQTAHYYYYRPPQ